MGKQARTPTANVVGRHRSGVITQAFQYHKTLLSNQQPTDFEVKSKYQETFSEKWMNYRELL